MSRIPAEARIQVVRTPPQPGLLPRGGEGGRRPDEGACRTLIIPPEEVRQKFKRVKPLKEIGVKERGWTLDVLNVVRRLIEERGSATRSRWGEATDEPAREDARPTSTFTTSDVYAFTHELEKLHPDNSDKKHRKQAAMCVIKSASNYR